MEVPGKSVLQRLAVVTTICDETHDGAKVISDEVRYKLEQMAYSAAENSRVREALDLVEGLYRERR